MTMKSYLDQLNAEAEAVNLRSEKTKLKPSSADSRILCNTPLVVQIEALVRSLFPA